MAVSKHGMTLTTGINTLLKQVGEQGESPIDEPDDGEYTPRTSTIEELKQMKADYEAGRIKATDWEVVKARANAIHS